MEAKFTKNKKEYVIVEDKASLETVQESVRR